MESIYRLGILINLSDRVSGPLDRLGHRIAVFRENLERLRPGFEAFRTFGAWMMGVGVAAGIGIGAAVHQFATLEEAQNRLQTTLMDKTGAVNNDYQELLRLSSELGTSLPGSTKDMVQMFIALREQGVQTKVILNGVGEATAKFSVLMKVPYVEGATKVAKFVEALGVADDQSVALMDTLQRLKDAAGVNVGDLFESFKYLGSTLKTLRVQGLNAGWDVSAAIGMMATSSVEGSQAGTNFAMALSRMAEITHKLEGKRIANMVGPLLDGKGIKLNFFDDKGAFVGIRNMIGEMEKLRALKDNDRLFVLSKLFGEEATRPMSIFIDKGVAGYDEMIKRMQDQADMQTKINKIMSSLVNVWDTLTGTIGDFVSNLGKAFTNLTGLPGILGMINGLFGRLNSFILANPKTAGVIAALVIALTAAAIAGGAFFFVAGGIGLALPKVIEGVALLATGLKALPAFLLAARTGFIVAAVAAWNFAAALLANPVTWIVIGITAAVVALGAAFVWLYRNVEWFRTGVQGAIFTIGVALGILGRILHFVFIQGWWGMIQLVMEGIRFLIDLARKIGPAISDAIAGALNAIPNMLGGMFESGQKLITTIIDGILSKAPSLKNITRQVLDDSVRVQLPFSDAKEGPLSSLTLSGARMMETLGAGVLRGAPSLQRTVAAALAGTALATSIAVSPAAAGEAPSPRSEGKKTIIQQLIVQLPGVTDGKSFVEQLQALVEGIDG